MRNLWVNEHRQQVCMVGIDGVDVAGGVAPDDVVEKAETLSAVRSMCATSVAVETLVEHAQGYSLAEIAERNGVPLGTVKRRIHDARMMIKRKKPLAS
jgi:DNA-directed RNA polymerase specialized sigma24 family protein